MSARAWEAAIAAAGPVAIAFGGRAWGKAAGATEDAKGAALNAIWNLHRVSFRGRTPIQAEMPELLEPALRLEHAAHARDAAQRGDPPLW